MPTPIETMPLACRRLQALAERDPRRAARFAQRVLDSAATVRSSELPWLRYALGWSLLCYERFGAAVAVLSEAEAVFIAVDHTHGRLHCRYALLVARMMQQIDASAVEAFADVATAFERAHLPADAVRARLYQAVALNILGRPREAETVLAQATPGPSDAVAQARWLRVAAASATGLSNYQVATARLEQATDAFAALGLRIDLAKCWYERGWLAQRCQELLHAQHCYEHAEQLFARADLPLRRALCAKDRGLVQMRMGAYDAALANTSRALAYFQPLGRMRDLAGCQLHLGNIYNYTGRWEAALACYTRAETLFAEAGVQGDRRVAQRNQAIGFQKLGRLDEAAGLLAALEQEAQTHGNGGELADVWFQQAELLAAQGRHEAALAQLSRAREQYDRLQNAASAAVCLLEQGWIALAGGDRRAAHPLFQRAAPALHQHPHHQWRLRYGLARCAELEGTPEVSLGHYHAASELVYRLRRTLASEESSSGVYEQAALLYVDSLRLAASLSRPRDVLELGERQRALVLQRMLTYQPAAFTHDERSQHDALRRQLLHLISSVEGAAAPSQLDQAIAAYNDLLLRARHRTPQELSPDTPLASRFDLASLRALMARAYGDDWTALAYMPLTDRFLVVIVTPRELLMEEAEGDAALVRLVERTYQPDYRAYTYRDLPYLQGQTTRPWATLHTLAERLIPAAVRERLHADHRLLIVPAAQLHQIPWPALRLGDRWLAECAVVQLAPSLSIMQALAEREPPTGSAALLLGCSMFGDRAPGLPGVAEELAAIAGVLDAQPVICQQDAAATRTWLLSASNDGALLPYSHVHIASHAQLLPTRGAAAHLKLWDDELLLDEVAGLRLDAEVVTLSACDGAAPDLLPGEEALSLSRALLAAGGRAVVASLWPVYDRATLALMQAFYHSLAGGHDAAAALALAQRALIARYQQDGDVVAEAQQWGSFVISGWSVSRQERRVVPPAAPEDRRRA